MKKVMIKSKEAGEGRVQYWVCKKCRLVKDCISIQKSNAKDKPMLISCGLANFKRLYKTDPRLG